MRNLIKRTLSSIILLPLVIYLTLKGSLYLIFLTVICFLACFYEWHKMVKNKFFKLSGFIFLFFSFYTFYELSIKSLILIPLFICIFTDIGGYVFGKIFKGPKLTKISPNKTYTGAFGGFFLSIIAGFTYFNFFIENITLRDEQYIAVIFFIFLISLISQIGDLIISFFKRIAKIKNTGKILPGHGGLLDRIDGIIFTIPTSFAILNYINF